MSRSRKKPIVTISKRWDNFKERTFRRLMKREVQRVEQEIPFDPDADFEACSDYGKMGSWGTQIGFYAPPHENEPPYWHEAYEKDQRK